MLDEIEWLIYILKAYLGYHFRVDFTMNKRIFLCMCTSELQNVHFYTF